jgi:DNA-binding transcriptional ArsR family regulator
MADVDLAFIARLVGEPSRATMLTALLDGRALTAGELATSAGIGAPTASAHLAKLLDGGLVTMTAQGRHRYYRLAGTEVASALEALAAVSPPKPVNTLRASAAAHGLRPARYCYDHLAGELGVRIYYHVVAIDGLAMTADGLTLTAAGEAWFAACGVDVDRARSARRALVRQCIDWTERRPHLAGALAAELAAALLRQRWIARRAAGERGITITDRGRIELERRMAPVRSAKMGA